MRDSIVERITEEVRERERHLREQRGAPLVLHTHDSQLYSVKNDRTGRQAAIAFDGLQHIIEIRGEGIHYTFEISITDGRPTSQRRLWPVQESGPPCRRPRPQRKPKVHSSQVPARNMRS